MTPHSSLWATNKYSTFSPKHRHNDLRLVCSATCRRSPTRPAVHHVQDMGQVSSITYTQKYFCQHIWSGDRLAVPLHQEIKPYSIIIINSMKKFVSLCAFVAALSFASCGGEQAQNAAAAADSTANSVVEQVVAPVEEAVQTIDSTATAAVEATTEAVQEVVAQ